MTRIGIVLATAADVEHATAIALAARRAGAAVALFAMADGVSALVGHASALATLVAVDCAITACATSADADAIEIPAHVIAGSQDDHAALVATCDRVIALT